MNLLLACILLFGLTSTAISAQTLVRLEVESESWLGRTPLDVAAEVTKRLREANIEVTDAPNAPLVRFSYAENPTRGYSPGLVPATLIRFEMDVRSVDQSHTVEVRSISAPLRGDNSEFPSAEELRQRSIATFKQDKSFLLVGHRVGTALGIESSFRELLADDEAGQMSWVQILLFSKLAWSGLNDDLFEQVLTLRARRSSPTDETARKQSEYFLKKNLIALQNSPSAPMKAPLLAIDILGEYGDRSSSQVLNDLMLNPQLAVSASSALQRIEARANASVP
jgi:hypothetical protein